MNNKPTLAETLIEAGKQIQKLSDENEQIKAISRENASDLEAIVARVQNTRSFTHCPICKYLEDFRKPTPCNLCKE